MNRRTDNTYAVKVRKEKGREGTGEGALHWQKWRVRGLGRERRSDEIEGAREGVVISRCMCPCVCVGRDV